MYQKLNAGRALRIVFSDTIPIPNIATEATSGTTTATTANKLVDSSKDFEALGIKAGFIIYNTSDNTAALVTAVDDETTLSVSADVFASGENYRIFAEEEKNGAILYVGGLGEADADDIRVLTAGEDDVTILGVSRGLVPLQVRKVFSTSTTVASAYALW